MTAWLGCWLPLALAYAVALRWCVDRWNAPTEYFAHCWLLPPLAAWLVWSRRATWRQVPTHGERAGLWLLVPGLGLHFAGVLLMVDSWSAASLLLTVPGALWCSLGRARLAGHWPIVGLLLFVVPAPVFVEGRLAFGLKEIAVQGGTALANGFGVAVRRVGDELALPGQSGALYVADACGGLRSLLAMLTLAYCLAFFLGTPSPRRRVGLLLAAPILAVAANTTRIAVLCLLARTFGLEFAQGTGHSVANAAEWVVLVLALLGIDLALSRRAPAPAAAVVATGGPGGVQATALSPRRLWLPLWLLAVPLLLLSLHRPAGVSRDRAERLPMALAGYTLMPRSSEAEAAFQARLPRWRELLGTADFVWRHYRGPQGRDVQLVALFHDANWKSVHPPRICIEGSDMDIERDDLVELPDLGAAVVGSKVVARRRSDGWRFVTLSVFGTTDWLSGDYYAFTWYHLPRALLRANRSGFLLRAESAIWADESEADAARRCLRFLRAAVPAARELLE
jgi:exosortase